jgi:hypothetical protein
LTAVHDKITRLNPLCPLVYVGDPHKREMLRQAALGESWAKDAARKATTEQISFTQLFQELAAAVQQEIEERMKVARDSYQPPQAAALPSSVNYGRR